MSKRTKIKPVMAWGMVHLKTGKLVGPWPTLRLCHQIMAVENFHGRRYRRARVRITEVKP